VGQAGNPEVMVRARDVELRKEDIGHAGVEVLAGVDDDLADGRGCPAAFCSRMARLTVAALMNWGRAPMTVRIFTR
jgi:hypothetical protein